MAPQNLTGLVPLAPMASRRINSSCWLLRVSSVPPRHMKTSSSAGRACSLSLSLMAQDETGCHHWHLD